MKFRLLPHLVFWSLGLWALVPAAHAASTPPKTFADFAAVTPVGTDYLVGYRPPMAAGAERRYTLAELTTFFSTSITSFQPASGNLTTWAAVAPSLNGRALVAAADYAAMRVLLGLDQVTNTSDANKPVSTAQQAALDQKASLSALAAVNGSGPNASDGLVHWSQIKGMPAGFADGSDDGAGGGSGTVTSSGSPVANQVAVFATGTNIIGESTTGSGNHVRASDPVIVSPTAPMSGFVVDVTKLKNTQSVSANQTFTFSATPPAGARFGVLVENTDTADHTITIPSSYSLARGATRTSVRVLASSKHYLVWTYDDGVYHLQGDYVGLHEIADVTPTGSSYVVANEGGVDGKATVAAIVATQIGTAVQAHSAALDAFATNGSAYYRDRANHTGTQPAATVTALPETWAIPMGDESTAITAGTAKVTWRAPFACTITAVRASLTTASSSGNPTFDIKEAGTSILSTKLSIDSGAKTSVGATTAAVISDNTLADDAELTFDVLTAGTGATGAKITIYVTRN